MSPDEIIADYIYRELRGDDYACPNDKENCLLCKKAALEHAMAIIDALAAKGYHPALTLSPDATKAFVEALMNPQPPNEYLRRAAQEMKETFDHE